MVMRKSATDVMQEAMLAAVVDAIAALKDSSRGVPNTLLRDLNAIHANTTFADLPPVLQASIVASVRAGFQRLLKEGYSVSSGTAETQPARPSEGRNDRAARAPRPDDGNRRGPRTAPHGDRPKGPRAPGRPGPRSGR
jgi:hypothetical protein